MVHRRRATVIHPLGGIKPPYLLRYSVGSRRDTWSKLAKMPVKRRCRAVPE